MRIQVMPIFSHLVSLLVFVRSCEQLSHTDKIIQAKFEKLSSPKYLEDDYMNELTHCFILQTKHGSINITGMDCIVVNYYSIASAVVSIFTYLAVYIELERNKQRMHS
ncbi:uncharacterized protein LOC131433159 isoform X2 [Malaya genurostris]|uniref:uncharacterized protein LOC131433159 isoform X2 n=1 Tax=Malaya genurostris TaxID=325434 RepID=UPI0026F3AAE0|nr:uncharacterized protein LOC131433159 isoform X2 [Malaya genurostris]